MAERSDVTSSGEHRRTRSDTTGGYYCVYDGEDWPCRATSDLTEQDANDAAQPRDIGPE